MRYIIINRRIGEQAYASWGFPVFYAARSLREFIREIIMKDEGKELILLHTDPTRAQSFRISLHFFARFTTNSFLAGTFIVSTFELFIHIIYFYRE